MEPIFDQRASAPIERPMPGEQGEGVSWQISEAIRPTGPKVIGRLPSVLLIHNFYQQAGGEDSVVANELQLLRANGHEATLYSVHNNDIESFTDKTRVFMEIGYSRRARDALAKKLKQVRPDVVHVHNFFPLLTTSIYDACIDAGIPVVQTLHNFRIMCAGVFLMRDGKVCEKCIDHGPYQSVVHQCYRGSAAGTFAVARMIDINQRRGTWRNKVDRFIALTPSAKELFVRGGVPAEKVAVKPNFAPDLGEPPIMPRHGALYVGRLSDEKGVREMVQAWQHIDTPLRIAGDGPLAEELKANAPPHVTFLGRIDASDVRREMLAAQMLIVFSKWYEGFPVVLAEAMAAGLPAMVSDIGSPKDIVQHGVTGMHVKTGDASALTATVNGVLQRPELLASMAQAARAEFTRRYSPQANYRELASIYRDALHERHSKTRTAVNAGDAAMPLARRGEEWSTEVVARAFVEQARTGRAERTEAEGALARAQRRPAVAAREARLPRVLIAHNYYQQAGGEDAVVANEKKLLEQHGHVVSLHSEHNDRIVSVTDKSRVFTDIGYSAQSRDALARRIAEVKPDIVHVHNFFPLLTTSIYDACIDAGVPVVQTLHNFRITCAGVFLSRDGKPCQKCLDGSPYWGVVHRCYRGSAVGSYAVARMIDGNRRRGTWGAKVDRFIALTPSARDLFIKAGLPADRIAVKPNFAPDPGFANTGERHGALYVGRLSSEKGVLEMVQAWRDLDYPLRIVGDGPLLAELRAQARGNITFAGRLSSEQVQEEMQKAAMLISFSTCLEGFPVVLAEALACGLPAIVADFGAPQDIIKNGVTGLHATVGDPASLRAAVLKLAGDTDAIKRMSAAAREDYVANYDPQSNYRALIDIYHGVGRVRRGA